MNAIAQTEFNPSLAVINGTIKTTSLKLAEHFEKQHKSVLRSIKNLDCSQEFHQRNFAPMQIDVEIGNGAVRKDTAFEITRDGFTFLAMGFTGKEAAKWKEAYINAFNAMAEQLLSNPKQLEPETITKAQQGILFNVVAGKSDHSGKSRSYYWSRFANHFKLASYKDLRSELFEEAHHYLQGLEGEEMLYLTVKELSRIVDEQIKKSIEGELLPKQEIHQHNSITINLAPLNADKRHRRWLITQAMDEMTILMPLDLNQDVKTREQFIQDLIRDGYLVMKKEDILGRLQN